GPVPPVNEVIIDYNCDGSGNVTINSTPLTNDYTYQLNGSGEQLSNTFPNIAPGSHTVTVNYVSNLPSSPSVLLTETFGAGATTTNPTNAADCCFEDQLPGSTCPHPSTSAISINDGEYAVTSNIVSPFPTWHDPSDHTGDPNGRMLVINIGGVVGIDGVIYEKPINDITPGQDLYVSLWALNLLRAGQSGVDPAVRIQLVDGSDNVIDEIATGDIPKTPTADFINYSLPLNPGANTNLILRIRTEKNDNGGNDIAIDDITVFQDPVKCPLSVDVPVTIEAGNGFSAAEASS